MTEALRRFQGKGYNPTRGGHAPSYLREALQDAVGGDGRLADSVVIDDVGIDEEERPLEWLIGQLWNCTDSPPATECRALDIPPGSTYAQAVRTVQCRLTTRAS
jgi:hypothetical protein